MKIKSFVFLLTLCFIIFFHATFIPAQTTGKYIYVGNQARTINSISIVDVETNTIVGTIPNIYGPQNIFISPDGLQAYIQSSEGIAVVDTSDHSVTEPGLCSGMRSIAFSPEINKVFIGTNNPYQAWNGGDCRYGGGLQIYDTVSFDHVACFGTEDYGPWATSVRPDGKYAYTISFYNAASSLRIIDVDTNTVRNIKPLSVRYVRDMAQDPNGKYLYMTGISYWTPDWCQWPCDQHRYGYLFTVDMETNDVMDFLTMKIQKSQFSDLAVSPDGKYACVIDNFYRKLYIINLQNYSYSSVDMGEITFDENTRTQNIIFSPDNLFVYLLGLETYRIAKINLNTATEVANTYLENKPYQMIITPDGNYIYVTIPRLNIVSVIDTDSNEIIKNISNFSYPAPIAFVSYDNNPPLPDAGSDIIISSQDQDSIVIKGTATDPDDDLLYYRWLSDGDEIQTWQPVSSIGEAFLDLFDVSNFFIGEYRLTLEVDDGQYTASSSITLTIGNSMPVVTATGSGTYQIFDHVTLSGQVSDFDGDLLTYSWQDGEKILCSDQIQTDSEGTPIALPDCIVDTLSLGVHNITLNVDDGTNYTVTSAIEVEVIDSIAPTLIPKTGDTILWPSDHKMVDILIEANASDNGGGPVTLNALIYCNETENGLGDGDFAPDWTEPVIDQSNGTLTFQLRRERFGSGTSREYSVIIVAIDESENSSQAQIKFIVPHDKRKK